MIKDLEKYSQMGEGLLTKDFTIRLDLNSIKQKFPTLPESYLSVIETYDFKEKLSPQRHTFLEKAMLLGALYQKSIAHISETFLKDHDLIPIGTKPRDLICVAGIESKVFEEGEIVLIQEFLLQDVPSAENLQSIAKDLSQFLMLEANVDHALKKIMKDEAFLKLSREAKYHHAKEHTQKILQIVQVDKKYHSYWMEELTHSLEKILPPS